MSGGLPSSVFITQLKAYEGFRASPYLCPAGACTIGYGTNLEALPQYIPWADLRANVQVGRLRGEDLRLALLGRGVSWDVPTAEAAMREEIDACIKLLTAQCPEFLMLTLAGDIPRAEVLLNMAYNMGVGGLLKFRNTLALLRSAMENGNYSRVAAGMLNSLWARQVGYRAREMAEQMRTGRYADKYLGAR